MSPVDALWFLAGVLVVALGLALSIALHEVGHLVPAKAFGVRVTQYMVGFGPTVASWRRGETEYGIKAVPLGGYVAMVGMLPPPRSGTVARTGSTGMLARAGRMADDARAQAAAELTAADEGRQFIQLPVWKRVVIMLGGPFMNLLIALALTGVLVSTFGVSQPSTTAAEVYRCVVPAADRQAREAAGEDPEACREGDPVAPAYAAGLRPGDTVVSFAGQEVRTWDQLSAAIRERAGQPTPIAWERGGQRIESTLTPRLTERPVTDALGMPEHAADGGVTPAERDPNGPMSVVGVGRIAGEAAALDSVALADKAALMLSLVAGVNVALMVFNLIPLLPLDGGHVAGALWEGLRRGWARLRGRPDPGPFDLAVMMPLTYVVGAAMLAMGVLLIVADVVEPVRLF